MSETKVTDSIVVRCPKCRVEMISPRAEWDYPEAVRVEIECPECNSGDFDWPTYFDAQGDEVVYDPADIPAHRAQLEVASTNEAKS